MNISCTRGLFAAIVLLLGTLLSADGQGIYVCQGPCKQIINGLTLSGQTFVGGAPSGTVIGSLSTVLSPTAPGFTGSYVLSGPDAGKFQIVGGTLETNGIVSGGTYQITVTAQQSGTVNGSFNVAYQIIGSASVTLPSGVTLQAIDGETLTGANNVLTTTNTHSYFTSHGFTNAASSAFNSNYNNGGWDDPRFFPICNDFAFYPTNSITVFQSLKLNCALRVTSDMTLSSLDTPGIYAIVDGTGNGPGVETVGLHIEEPSGWASGANPITTQVTNFGALNSNHYRHLAATQNQFIFGGYGDTPACGSNAAGSMQSAMDCPITVAGDGTVHLDIPSADIYWFAGSTNATSTCSVTYLGGIMYGGSTVGACSNTYLSRDQTARGDHYGDMVDTERTWLANNPAPVIGPYMENDDGLLGDTGHRRILPQEYNWGVWNTIVHGARGLDVFGTTSNNGCGATFGFCTDVVTGGSLAGPAITGSASSCGGSAATANICNQAVTTHGAVLGVAPIINSPFALGYASVTPVGYVFPTLRFSLTNGIDVMAKWYTGAALSNSLCTCGPGFYVFATLHGSETQSSVTATFTLNGSPSKTISVVGESRNVSSNGSGVFTDTFSYPGSTVHIYGPVTYP